MNKKHYLRIIANITKINGPLQTQCWVCNYHKDKDGYSIIKVDGKNNKVHRFMYIYKYGLILDNLQIDHICRNRACCNPKHLEAVTYLENIKRGFSPMGHSLRTNTCIRGHSLENALIKSSGGRTCRTCKQWREKGWLSNINFKSPQYQLFITEPIDLEL